MIPVTDQMCLDSIKEKYAIKYLILKDPELLKRKITKKMEVPGKGKTNKNNRNICDSS